MMCFVIADSVLLIILLFVYIQLVAVFLLSLSFTSRLAAASFSRWRPMGGSIGLNRPIGPSGVRGQMRRVLKWCGEAVQ